MYYFYVLYSLKDGRLYKGSSSDLLERMLQHNAGRTKSTKHRRPLILIYFEKHDDKETAMKRERWSKTLEGGKQLKEMLVEKELLLENSRLNDRSSAG